MRLAHVVLHSLPEHILAIAAVEASEVKAFVLQEIQQRFVILTDSRFPLLPGLNVLGHIQAQHRQLAAVAAISLATGVWVECLITRATHVQRQLLAAERAPLKAFKNRLCFAL
jgi:hypothetical protein